MPTVGEQRFAQALARWLDYHESTALEVLQDLMPVLPVLDPSAPELLYPRGEAQYFTYKTTPANGVGQFSYNIIRNPTGSGKLCTLHRILNVRNTGQPPASVSYSAYASELVGANPAVGVAADKRNIAPSVLTISHASDAAVLPTLFWISVAQDQLTALLAPTSAPVPYILTPGTVLLVTCGDDNSDMTTLLHWTERAVSGAEQQRW